MFHFHGQENEQYAASPRIQKVRLALAVAVLVVAGCSDQANNAANNQAKSPAPAVVKKTPAANKTAAARPATAPAKPSPKPASKAAQSGSAAAPKQVNASSKTPVPGKSTNPGKNAAPTTLISVPKGTVISAKLGEGLASSKNHAGDTFQAVLTSSVKVDGKTVIPKGTHVIGRVVTVNKKNPELTVTLASVDLSGKSYRLATEPVAAGKSTVKSDAEGGNPATAAKEITVPADRRLKFKLTKTLKLPVKS